MSAITIPNSVAETRSNSLTDNSIKRIAEGVSAPPPAASEAAGTNKNTVAFSSLAQQLAEAATRAAERDASLGRQELATKGKYLTDIIVGSDYYTKKTIHDAEVPKTNDPLHLARARQATAFTNNREGPNPFKGMSREQLSLIAYDESGTFTVNERNAAWSEGNAQDQVQKRILCAKIVEEYNRTGKVVNSLLDVLKFYKSLPAIDQAVKIPAGYEEELRSRISEGGSIQSREELSLLGLGTEWDFNKSSQSKDTSLIPKTSFNG